MGDLHAEVPVGPIQGPLGHDVPQDLVEGLHRPGGDVLSWWWLSLLSLWSSQSVVSKRVCFKDDVWVVARVVNSTILVAHVVEVIPPQQCR